MNCKHYLEYMSYNNQLQSPKELLNIIMKLPYKIREQWRRKCYYLSKGGLNVNFTVLVEFVREESQLLWQPIFGNITDSCEAQFRDERTKYKLLFVETNIEDSLNETVVR
jgi:hypothetical protein